jgi:hypothetical protein
MSNILILGKRTYIKNWYLYVTCYETSPSKSPRFVPTCLFLTDPCITSHFLKLHMGAWAHQHKRYLQESKYHYDEVHNLTNQLAFG